MALPIQPNTWKERQVGRAPAVYPRPAIALEEMEQINMLIGTALTQRSIHDRLIHQRDHHLRHEFNISQEAWTRIVNLGATTLEELCQGIVRIQSPY